MGLKKIARSMLEKMGYDVMRTTNRRRLDMEGAVERLSKRNFNIGTVIDVGASNGSWSAMCMKYFKNASYFLIEANNIHQSELDTFKKEHANANYVLAAAGNEPGEIFFDDSDPFGGTASANKTDGKYKAVPMTAIDIEVKKNNLKGPFFIKLDTHGFEIPIIEGAMNAVKEAEILAIETYNYELTGKSLKFYEMCAYLEKLGFRPLEIANPMLRRKDSTFWQMDIFFVRKTRPEFTYNSYI
jgi:FkbM family methyltransferase